MANRKKEKPLVRVTVSLEPDDYVAFEALGHQDDRSAAYLIRQAMKSYLALRQQGGQLQVGSIDTGIAQWEMKKPTI